MDELPADGGSHEVFRFELRLDRAWGRWRWQDARAYRNEDFNDVVALHRAVVAAALARDAARLAELFGIKHREVGRSVDEVRSDDFNTAMWREWLAKTVDVLVAPDDQLTATSWSDGRLVDVGTKDGRAPLTLVVDGGRVRVSYVVSALEEGLRIVR
jgi:hypothetical protein